MPPRKTRSDYIPRVAAERFLEAVRFARAVGRPLNMHVTYSPFREGVSEISSLDELADVRLAVAGWLRKRGEPATFAWVVESTEKDGTGLHLHLLLHVPELLIAPFGEWLLDRYGHPTVAVTDANWKAPSYLLKHADTRFLRSKGWFVQSGCKVLGQRVGCSQNINDKAREKAGLPPWTAPVKRMYHVGRDLQQYRARNDLTQEALAKLLNINRSHVANIERGVGLLSSTVEKRVRRLFASDVEFHPD